MDRDDESSAFSNSDELDRLSLGGSDLEMDQDGEDLFGEGFTKDYADQAHLDRYETEDEEEVAPLTRREFESAEREISQTFGYPSFEPAWSEGGGESEEQSESLDDFEALQKTIGSSEMREKVKKELVHFLKAYDNKKYLGMIKQMASMNMQSLYIDYFDLEKFNASIALAVVSLPIQTLPIANEALQTAVSSLFPKYSQIRPFLIFRVINIPSFDQIRDLRNSHLNTLVKVVGIITKRSRIYPLLSLAKYNCTKCKAILGPFLIESESAKPNRCLECQAGGSLVVNTTETIYKDFQKLSIQEVPGTVPSGRLPRAKEVIVLHDLIDYVKPGDEIELTGTYKNNFTNSISSRNGVPIFFTSVEALSIVKKGDESSLFSISPEDEKEIRRLSKSENIFSLVISSIAPSIHGQYEAKRAIALSIFGGVPKHSDGKHKVRGDINVLLLGDPGMGKSQLLKYVEKISHRAVFATGQGASAVGLTAMVRKDPVTGEWALEGGALVLADKGVCLIDEFDKMKDTDRVSIHEAMEQQSISISKAGIVTSLQARCAVIAAANPIRGKYNPSYTFSQNVNLSDPIITRFDIICVVKDECNPAYDRELATFIVSSHQRSLSSAYAEGPISQNLLRKYIAYARERVHPRFEAFDTERITSLYSSLRKESTFAGGMPITVRHVESIVRISEASARIHLRECVSKRDVDLAIAVVLDSFCGTQKIAVKRALTKKFSRYLPKPEEDSKQVLALLSAFFSRQENQAENLSLSEFKHKAHSLGMHADTFFQSKLFLASEYTLSLDGTCIARK
ncbi:DNA replication licensing factor MCM2 [Nematocida displodere]|uniref:DNA replication licensing factor MCM2 n=1 Tax=Nematocida displodere TaxID=1805483 RepID=A0A177ECK1_9MICR|nr:DNA replication licensing factor MCM2 [Nematocida displodere]